MTGLWIAVVLSAVVLILMYRNTAVLRFRLRLLDLVSAASRSDIDANQPWIWRYDAFGKVSYNRMVCCFWRPMWSFYPDRAFIRAKATHPEATR